MLKLMKVVQKMKHLTKLELKIDNYQSFLCIYIYLQHWELERVAVVLVDSVVVDLQLLQRRLLEELQGVEPLFDK